MTINKVDNNEKEFLQLGLDAFLSVEDDRNIDWIDFFQPQIIPDVEPITIENK